MQVTGMLTQPTTTNASDGHVNTYLILLVLFVQITDVPALALVFCLIWLGLIGYTSSLRHDIRTLLGPHLHQVNISTINICRHFTGQNMRHILEKYYTELR